MATKLYMKQFQNSFNTSTAYSHASLVASVLAFITSVTNTAASGTKIQCTKTAGGAALQHVTPPLAYPVTIASTITLNCWAKESNNSANAGMRCIITRYSDGAVISDTSKGVELTTSIAVQNWTDAAPTSTLVGAGDRIVITWYVTNVGTMGGSQTVTMDYGGNTAAADGDTWVQFTEGIIFQNEAEFIQQIDTGSGDTVALPGNCAAGNCLVGAVSWNNATSTISSLTGNSNSFSLDASPKIWGTGSARSNQKFWANNITAGATTLTVAWTGGTPGARHIYVEEWAGVSVTAKDANDTSNTGTATGATSGSITTAVVNEVLIGIADMESGSWTAGTNYVLRNGGTNMLFEDKTVTSIQTGVTVPATLSTTAQWVLGAISLKGGTQPTFEDDSWLPVPSKEIEPCITVW